MKKIISLICIAGMIAFGFNDAQAQDTRFGLKGGLTMYSMETSVMGFSETSDNKLGFTGGLFVEKPFSDMFSLQFEALYVQKGGDDSDEVIGDGTLTLSYVDVPVLLKVNIPLDGDISPFIYGGGFAGYLIDATAEGNGESMDVGDFFEDLNYGLMFGAGVSFGMAHVDIRYDMGLANLIDDGGEMGDVFGNGGIEVTTKGFMITAGISF